MNTDSIVILLSGYLGSGKDAVGAHLVKSYGFCRYAFADSLKDEVSACYTLDREGMNTQDGKNRMITLSDDHGHCKSPISVRELLISHGQMRRAQNIDYWVDKVAAKIMANRDHLIVITDWRFPNEYKKLHGYLRGWTLETFRINRWIRPPLFDESELALDNFSFNKVIENNGTLDTLVNIVDEALKQNLEKPLNKT